jgi:hypothetical protein
MTSIHARTIAALIVQQRLLNTDPLSELGEGYWGFMHRVEFTAEIMKNTSGGAFIRAIQEESRKGGW